MNGNIWIKDVQSPQWRILVSEDKLKFPQVKPEDWSRFIAEVIRPSIDSGREEIGDFKKLSKKYGVAYLSYLETAFYCKDSMSIEEFLRINGNVPIEFLKKFDALEVAV